MTGLDGWHGPLGIVSERDIVRAVSLGMPLQCTRACDVMSAPAISITPEDSIESASRLMLRAGLRHLPVVVSGEVTGVVSIRDTVESLLEGSVH